MNSFLRFCVRIKVVKVHTGEMKPAQNECSKNLSEKSKSIEFLFLVRTNIFFLLLSMPLFLLSTHKQRIKSHFIHNSTDMFP
jgi:hypothetical protein